MYLLAFEVFLLTAAVIKRNNQAVTASIFVLIGMPLPLDPSPLPLRPLRLPTQNTCLSATIIKVPRDRHLFC